MIRLGLIGPGNVGRSIALALPRDRYSLGPILGKGPSSAKRLVRELREGRAVFSVEAFRDCDVILIATPESALPQIVDDLQNAGFSWASKCVLDTCRESSGELARLVRLGASSAGVYPLQAFPKPKSRLQGVHFALAGDGPALRAARAMVRALQGHSHIVSRRLKQQVSVAASIASDVFSGLLELTIRRLMAAGFSRRRAVEAVRPIFLTTLEDRQRGGGRPAPFDASDAPIFDRLAAACDQEDAVDGILYRRALLLAMDALEVDDASLRFVASADERRVDRTVAAD